MPPTAPSVLDALLNPDATAAQLASVPPQGLLVEPLEALTPARLSLDGQIDAVVAAERHIALLQARSAELLAAIDAGDATPDGFVRDTVACALRLPPASMKTRMMLARELTERLPAALELLRSGLISQRHALDLADATRALSAPSARAVARRVLDRAPEQTAAQFRTSVKRAVLREASAADAAEQHRVALSERRVVITPVEHGMAELWALLPAEGAAKLKTVLDARAHATVHGRGGDARTADQRRADALVDLADHAFVCRRPDAALNIGGLGVGGPGAATAVQVTVAASTLAGTDDQPGELAGYGPITADMARRIAADPRAHRTLVVTTDDGRVLTPAPDSGTYRPPAQMAAQVIARDQHCAFPGCRRPAQYCDLDHVKPYRPGDQTTAANLMALCRRHHRLKHSGRFTVKRDDATGITAWTDRRGRVYRTHTPQVPTTVPP